MIVSKQTRLIKALTKGERFTAKQIRQKFGFGSINSVYATIHTLRDQGYSIEMQDNGRRAGKYAC